MCAMVSANRFRIPLLALFHTCINRWSASGSNNVTSTNFHQHQRILPVGIQDMCGSSYTDALECGVPCPGGVNEECPDGQQCYAEIECPLPSKISPGPTRSPVKGFDIGKHDKEIIGYYAAWQWYDRSKLAKPENMDFRKVTRVNYAFFQTDISGNIWGTDDWADPLVLFGDIDINAGACVDGSPGCKCSWVKPDSKRCGYHFEGTGLISRVHAAGKEIWPSIGGWTLSDSFPLMAKNPTSRAKFVENCIKLIKDYGFGGIDIDWEYPGFSDHSGTRDDTVSYNLLLEDLRAALDKLEQVSGNYFGITAALPCGPSHIENIDVPTVSKYLSELNLMTYDFHGAWDLVSGVNSPLHDQSGDPEPGWSVEGCVKSWVDKGAPKDKLNIGLAFYGRSFKNAKKIGELHGGADDINWEEDEGTPQYFNIIERRNLMTSLRDEQTKTQFSFFDQGGMVSFDDEQSICDKTQFANEQGLNGFIIWELSGDVMKDLNTPLLDMVNRKLAETNTDCADPLGQKENLTILDSPVADLSSLTSNAADALDAQTTTSTKATEEASKANEGSIASTYTSSTTTSSGHKLLDSQERKPVKLRSKNLERPYRPSKVNSEF